MKKLRKNWVLGFLGFIALYGLNYFKTNDPTNLIWIVWLIWFVWFLPVSKE